MATEPQGKHFLKDLPHVAHGSPEHEQLLSAGYGMTAAEAKEIVAAREANASAYSIAEVRKAQALLEGLKAKPVITAKRQMWKRPLSG